jgi:hypothetical protein
MFARVTRPVNCPSQLGGADSSSESTTHGPLAANGCTTQLTGAPLSAVHKVDYFPTALRVLDLKVKVLFDFDPLALEKFVQAPHLKRAHELCIPAQKLVANKHPRKRLVAGP